VIIGTVILMLAGEIFAGYAHYQLLMYSGFLILVLLFLPGGMVSLPGTLSKYFSGTGPQQLEDNKYGPA
jgi:ABC-type branched-subunit amino acid transport system permease subunit